MSRTLLGWPHVIHHNYSHRLSSGHSIRGHGRPSSAAASYRFSVNTETLRARWEIICAEE
jgi:hypothetical protein